MLSVLPDGSRNGEADSKAVNMIEIDLVCRHHGMMLSSGRARKPFQRPARTLGSTACVIRKKNTRLDESEAERRRKEPRAAVFTSSVRSVEMNGRKVV